MNRMKAWSKVWKALLVLSVANACFAYRVVAEDDIWTRAVVPELRNETPPFPVRLSVCVLDEGGNLVDPRESRVFFEGENLGIEVVSAEEGYLYIFWEHFNEQGESDNRVIRLFPNRFHLDNKIQTKTRILIPDSKYRFNFRIREPFGQERLYAIVTKTPLPESAVGVLSTADFQQIFAETTQKLLGRSISVLPRNQWAEYAVTIQTKPARDRVQHNGRVSRQVGLFVGISQYAQHPKVRNLRVADRDAQTFLAAIEGGRPLSEKIVLLNERATLKNVQQAFARLSEISQPGDEVFIYWSGHGATCADTNGDEPDGLDEALVCHDTMPGDLEDTAVLDDTLGRWIQDLDGRKVCLIIDTCYAGGVIQGRGPSTVESSADDKYLKDWQFTSALGEDFFRSELSQLKDVGQKNVVLLVSSAPDEASAEMRDGPLSVMTYFLVEKMENSSALTLAEAYDYVRTKVPAYMREHFPGRQQTPLLVPEEGGASIRLK